MADFGERADFGVDHFGILDTDIHSIFLPSTLRVLITSQIFLPSSLKVRVLANQLFLLSTLKVIIQTQLFLSSNLIVRIEGNQLSLPSKLSIVIVSVTENTPSCSFNAYNFNASSGTHIDDDIDFGEVEGTKTIIGFRSDPYENTYTSDDNHQIIWNVDSKSGTANYYHTPLVNGLSGDHEKISGMGQETWNEIWTTISGSWDVSGDYADSGSQINISVPNTGTVWSPPTSPGSNVYDIPALYNGSLVVVNQPTDWDLNPEHKIHDWCPYQMSIGHAVEVSDMDLINGTHVNNLIKVYGVVDVDYLIDFKVYHASPKEWQWYSGATLDANGTISGHIVDAWDFINNLDVGQQLNTGTYNYTLKLYSASGTYLYPDDPVRIINVEFIIE